MSDMLSAPDAAELADVTRSYVSRMAKRGRIDGARFEPLEGMQGRWYVPRAWAEAVRAGLSTPRKRDQVLNALAELPFASSSEIAKVAGCSASYVRMLRQEERGE